MFYLQVEGFPINPYFLFLNKKDMDNLNKDKVP